MRSLYSLTLDNSVNSILEDFKNDILSNANAKEYAAELRRQKVIAESTETDIKGARDARTANGILYDHLQTHSTMEQIRDLSRVLKNADSGFGRTKEVGERLYKRIQGTEAGATEPK